jgi:hypothetical protein
VLYRERQGPRGQASYTPRLVLFDAKGSLGGASLTAPTLPPAVATWDGGHEVHRAAPIAKSQFLTELEAEEELGYTEQQPHQQQQQQTEEPTALETAAAALDTPGAARFFTDFLKAPLHPRSVHLVDGLWRDSPDLRAWGRPGGWLGGGGGGDGREEALDHIRALAEESDGVAGFQCFVEDLSAWGGVAAEVLEEVRDEYGGGRAVAVWALRSSAPPTTTPADLRLRRLQEGLSTAVLSGHCDLFAPVAPPEAPGALSALAWRRGDPFHESALLAAALDGATLPYRLVSGRPGVDAATGATDFWSLTNLLQGRHRSPLVALSMALPCPEAVCASPESQDSRERPRESSRSGGGGGGSGGFTTAAVSLTGGGLGAASDRGRFAECVVLRGGRAGGQALPVPAAAAALDAALGLEGLRCVTHRAVTASPLPVPLPFPDIFSKRLNVWGEAVHRPAGEDLPGPHHVASCPLLVRMSGSTSFGPAAAALAKEWAAAAAMAPGRAALEGWGVEADQVQEVTERLRGLAHAYDADEL